MARATQSQAPEDIWHLSIDDLLASPAQTGAGAVAGPFVINLCLSSTPSGAMPRGMPRFDRLCIYQLKCAVGERRDEFRLRLGIIETELEADAILAAIREHYPAARKETASEDDAGAVALRMARARKRGGQVKRAEPKALPPKPAAKQPLPVPDAPKRDVMLRKNAGAPVAAIAAPPVPWNVDDVLPQFAGHAPFKYEATAPMSASARAVPAVLAAQAPASVAPVATPQVVAAAVVAPPVAAPVFAAPDVAAPVVNEPVAETVEIVAQADVGAETVFEFTADSAPEPAPAPVEMLEFELEPPSAAIVPPPAALAAHEADSNAITVEVETLTFTIDAPPAAIEPPHRELEITIEATHVSSTMTMEAPELQFEVDAPEASIESESLAEIAEAVATPNAPPPVLEEPVVVTRVTLTPRVAPAEPLPADEVVELLETRAPVTDSPPQSPSIGDSGSLEKLVAKIDSLVDEVSASPSSAEAVPIDSTITERALTQLDLSAEDDAAPCFVVQLILSEQQINPDHVPSLDIYSEYRLYRITGFDQGQVKHALRLGFFSSEPAAQAVAGYLALFFDSPTITRVSVVERERFAEDRMAAGKDIGATGTHSTIELTSPAPLPARREREVVQPQQDRSKSSLWSRIVAPLKR